MIKPLALAALTYLAGLTSISTQATDYWAVCRDCAAAAKNYALGVPADELGAHRVHIYDRFHNTLTSYRVTIAFDDRRRVRVRFAQPIPTPAADRMALDNAKRGQAELRWLADRAEPIDAGIGSVQQFLLASDALSEHLAHRMLTSLSAQGYLDRFLKAGAAVRTAAANVLFSRNSQATFRISFNDESSVLVTAEFAADASNAVSVTYVAGSARLPDGTLLPDDTNQFDDLLIASNNPKTVDVLADWVGSTGARPIRHISVTRDQHGALPSYVLSCNEHECVVTEVHESRDCGHSSHE
ncbi:MAG: hypothetical protein AAF270_12475 [Pseudomonadota bacterium]